MMIGAARSACAMTRALGINRSASAAKGPERDNISLRQPRADLGRHLRAGSAIGDREPADRQCGSVWQSDYGGNGGAEKADRSESPTICANSAVLSAAQTYPTRTKTLQVAATYIRD